MFYLQYKGQEKAAKVVEFVAKWLNLCLSTVSPKNGIRGTFKYVKSTVVLTTCAQLSYHPWYLLISKRVAIIPKYLRNLRNPCKITTISGVVSKAHVATKRKHWVLNFRKPARSSDNG